MWIRFKETYSGPEGVFAKGRRIELPDEKVCRIKQEFYEQACPPWEDHLDKNAMNKAAQKEAITKASQHLANLQAIADKAAETSGRLLKVLENKRAEAEAVAAERTKTVKLAKDTVKKLENTAKPKNKKQKKAFKVLTEKSASLTSIAVNLTRDLLRKEYAEDKAEGEQIAAEAVKGLAVLDVHDAQAVLDRLEEKAAGKPKKKAKAANPKPEVKDNDKDAKEQPVQPTAEGQGDQPLTKGPADKTEPQVE